ncbi:MAG: hypothetical protein RMK29_07415 [Myxococcales bacterium]|nr:hypothetical protein [Myxococcota bacterium]MDW8281522.1 hypothetical protein [Myxococcales bacterium]
MAPTGSSPRLLDEATWALLILLSGWFGALAYLAVVLIPRGGKARTQAAVALVGQGRPDQHCSRPDTKE